MPLTPGERFGAYEVIGSLGAGGMGEVYRARDLKLQREVALKILPDAFARDPDRLARFGREAQVLAALSHPAIGAIHGLEETDGRRALVLELVEGPTLADLLVRGPMKQADALRLARQMAAALEAAHGKGIVHRDLKPANLKVTAATVKVLDFGLAKIRDGRRTSADTSNSPTVMTSMPGVILGTAAYMSPEQATGEEIDHTADIWAFGCVLYEMLAGQSAFRGKSVSEIVSEVLKSEPEWQRLPADTPPSIRRLLRRCLRKDPRERLQHIGDARIEIDDAMYEPEEATPGRPRPSRREQIAWTALALVTLSAAAFVWIRPSVALPVGHEMRLELNTPPTTDTTSLAISPDGQRVVFAGESEGGARLWMRSLGSVSPRPLPGTERAQFPFWSPDGKAIGFFSDGKLKRLDVDTGAVQNITNAIAARGGTWNRDGVILFAPNNTGRLWRVSARGGPPVQVTTGTNRGSDRFPIFLPDGNHFVFFVQGTNSGVYLGDLAGTEPRRLLEADVAAAFLPPGHLLFIRQQTLFSQAFDPMRLTLTGDPSPMGEENVAVAGAFGNPALSTSATGTIIYRTGAAGGRRQFGWVERSGTETGTVGIQDSGGPTNPSMSPDGRHIALYRTASANVDVWLLDIVRGVLSRFTSDAANDVNPVWSPDGARIAFQSNRTGVSDLYVKSASGAGGDQVLLSTPEDKAPSDWSHDGRFLLYRNTGPKTGYDLWALPMTGDRKQFPVVETEFEERDGQFSPDGKWVAYQSNESGRFEIYVQPFPGTGGKWPISTNGGAQVRWRPDGKELFYIAMDAKLMAVPIALGGNQPEIGAPIALFTTRLGGAVQGIAKQQYVVSANGQRFLINTVTNEPASPISVILNWKSGS